MLNMSGRGEGDRSRDSEVSEEDLVEVEDTPRDFPTGQPHGRVAAASGVGARSETTLLLDILAQTQATLSEVKKEFASLKASKDKSEDDVSLIDSVPKALLYLAGQAAYSGVVKCDDSSEGSRDFPSKHSKARVVLSPDFVKDSFLGDPEVHTPSGSSSHEFMRWSDGTKFPTGSKTTILPTESKFSSMMDFKFSDTTSDLGAYFTGKLWSERKIGLDTRFFDIPSYSPPQHWNHRTLDTYTKDAAIVNFTSDELTQACLSDLKSVDFTSKDDMEAVIRRTTLVMDLISGNNLRAQ